MATCCQAKPPTFLHGVQVITIVPRMFYIARVGFGPPSVVLGGLLLSLCLGIILGGAQEIINEVKD